MAEQVGLEHQLDAYVERQAAQQQDRQPGMPTPSSSCSTSSHARQRSTSRIATTDAVSTLAHWRQARGAAGGSPDRSPARWPAPRGCGNPREPAACSRRSSSTDLVEADQRSSTMKIDALHQCGFLQLARTARPARGCVAPRRAMAACDQLARPRCGEDVQRGLGGAALRGDFRAHAGQVGRALRRRPAGRRRPASGRPAAAPRRRPGPARWRLRP